jgi:hypothetical protein
VYTRAKKVSKKGYRGTLDHNKKGWSQFCDLLLQQLFRIRMESALDWRMNPDQHSECESDSGRKTSHKKLKN